MATLATVCPVVAVADEDENFYDARSRTPSVELEELSLAEAGSDAAGGHAETAPPSAPEDRGVLVERVRALIDFYFGDANFAKDQFLRKHASTDPLCEGWIQVELVCSFKKVKLLTLDPTVVLDGMRKSTIVVLSEGEDRLKRKDPMENFIEDVLARTIHLSVPRETSESVIRELCAPFGELARLRLLDPATTPLPAEIAQHCVDETGHARFRQLPGMLSAFVQYGSIKQAGVASRALAAKRDWQFPLLVDLIFIKPKNPASSSSASPAPASRENSPGAATFASRYRSPSFHTSASSGHHSPLAADQPTGALQPPSSYSPSRPRSNSFNMRRAGGSPGSSPDSNSASPGQHGSNGPHGHEADSRPGLAGLGLSPGTRRRFVTGHSGSMPTMVSGRSGLSQVESPEAWRARDHQARAQAILRSPSGPTQAGRGFVRHSAGAALSGAVGALASNADTATTAGMGRACPW